MLALGKCQVAYGVQVPISGHLTWAFSQIAQVSGARRQFAVAEHMGQATFTIAIHDPKMLWLRIAPPVEHSGTEQVRLPSLWMSTTPAQ